MKTTPPMMKYSGKQSTPWRVGTRGVPVINGYETSSFSPSLRIVSLRISPEFTDSTRLLILPHQELFLDKSMQIFYSSQSDARAEMLLLENMHCAFKVKQPAMLAMISTGMITYVL